KVTYTYDIELDEKSYKMLLDRFYSAENLDRLTSKLRENGFDRYAQQMSKANIQLEISDAPFTMTIVGSPAKDMQRISSIVRDNFEKVIPVYSVKKELGIAIAKFKSEMADIEENKFSLELKLERKKAILTKLKDLVSSDSSKIPGSIVLHFDNVGENSEYLPLAYQAQATDANIINLEEIVRTNHKMYDYYKGLLSLNERLFEQVRDKASSHYTIQEFHALLTNIASEYEDEELIGYLNAYIKKIENTISTNIPIVEEPKLLLIPKGSVNKSVIVLAVLLMIITFAAFLLEGIEKNRTHAK
ncbi:MAG: hypothetical protein ACYTBX_04165, partial [Planctomycetota bacterium]